MKVGVLIRDIFDRMIPASNVLENAPEDEMASPHVTSLIQVYSRRRRLVNMHISLRGITYTACLME
jgi:hypothetical protein